MKITKKTLIIMLVVAVVVYLLWRMRKQNMVVTYSGTETATIEPDHTTLGYILTHIDFNSTERNKIEAYRLASESQNTLRQIIEAKAIKNGLSYDQQLVCEALWLLYHDNTGWTNDRGWKLIAEVKSL